MLAARAASAEDVVLAGAQRKAVNEALAKLPTRQREVLVLRYHLGLSEARDRPGPADRPGRGEEPREPGPGSPAHRNGVE